MYARIIVLFVVIAVLAFVLAIAGLALSGGDDDDAESTPDQTDSVDGELASCSALTELDSYRYTVTVHIAGVPTPTEPAEGELTPAPLSALGDALAQLLSDFTLEGAYVNPDRSLAILTVGTDEIELRQIGDEAWVRVGDTWEPEDASTGELLTPVLVCSDVIQAVSPSLAASDPPPESSFSGGDFYALDPARSANLPPLLGQELEGAYTVALWIDEDTRHPQRLVIQSNDPDAEEPAFLLVMDVFDVNAEEISVEAPE